MNNFKFSPKLLIGLLVAVFFFVALSFRIFLPYDQVFSSEWIKFTSIDAYFHMRLVDNLVHNFPMLTNFDPYYIYPQGVVLGNTSFFDWFLAGIIWVIGLGSPTQQTVNTIGAYFPAILAALTVIPVYFIGKALFNRWAGVIAAALVAVLPGEYIGRSILGFTDQHVAETLFSTVAALFLILAVKTASERQLTLSHLIHGDRAIITRPLVYGLFAGIFLGMYLITWLGALLFVFIISLYFIIQFIIDHLRHKSSDHLGIVGVILFLVAFIIYLPFSPRLDFSTIAMVIAVFIPVVLCGVSFLISKRKFKAIYYPLFLIVIGVAFTAVLYAISPNTLETMLAKFGDVFIPGGSSAATTLEMQPFLSPQGSFSTGVAWGNYTTSFFLFPSWPVPGFAFIAFIALIWLYIKRRSDEKHLLFFFVWTLIILVATLVQRRFAYYLVVNIALLSAYLSWQAIWLAGLKKLELKSGQVPESPRVEGKKAGTKEEHKKIWGVNIYYINSALAVIIIFFFVLFPNIVKAKEVASEARFAPSDAWQASLSWMKDNTPEPFGDSDAYYQISEVPAGLTSSRPNEGASTEELLEWVRLLREQVDYPESAYGVLSWWDYGYWITYIAHRSPNANPGQNPAALTLIARFFMSEEESAAGEIMQSWDSSYVVLDYAMATSKFWAVATWSGRDVDEFTGAYYLPHEGQLVPVQFYYPAYYRTTLVKLYNFNGDAVTDESPLVITYENKVDRAGNRYRQVTEINEYDSYQEALNHVESEGPDNHIIVGVNPLVSPVPLEAMQDFKLVYSSESGISNQEVGMIPEVKILEYLGD